MCKRVDRPGNGDPSKSQAVHMIGISLKTALYLSLVYLIAACSPAGKALRPRAELVSRIDNNFKQSAEQYLHMKSLLPPGRFPRSWYESQGRLETSGSDWWCSGFYPGTLLYLYEELRDTSLYNEAMRMLDLLEKEKLNTSTHDLGFMMFCSFGNANRMVPRPAYNEILLTSAKSLSTRFNPVVGCIKSWDSKTADFLVIIDNMMNLELLFWASRYSGDTSFRHVALTHANTTIENHFRSDFSSHHVVNYDPVTGQVQVKRTAQGYSDSSAWARGQAWGLYGFTVMYRETGDQRYLQQAESIADFLLNHPNLPADNIPYWDFNAPNIPNALRDASAAAIMSSALLELCTYVNRSSAKKYYAVAESILSTLSTPEYFATGKTNGGFLLRHGVGHLPQKSEVDVPLTYADYYYVEAMKRYKYGFKR